MDGDYLRNCVRYVGLNPVRVGLAGRAIAWPLSSVRVHVEGVADPLLTPAPTAERFGAEMPGLFELSVGAANPTRDCALVTNSKPSSGPKGPPAYGDQGLGNTPRCRHTERQAGPSATAKLSYNSATKAILRARLS